MSKEKNEKKTVKPAAKNEAKKPRKPRAPNQSLKRILAAIPDSGGVITRIADKLGLDRTTIYRRIHANPEVMEAIVAEREKILDIAEEGILAAVYSGDVPTCQWYLTRKGRDRGYGDKTEVEATVDAAISTVPVFKVVIEGEDNGGRK